MRKVIRSVFQIFFSYSAGLVLSTAAWADVPNCGVITNASKRLQCFDLQSKKNATQKLDAEAEESKRFARQEEERKRAEDEKQAQSRKTAEVEMKLAYKALRKLGIKIEAGINYRDYVSAFADAKSEVSNFLESPPAEFYPECAALLGLAVAHYSVANSTWSKKFEYASHATIPQRLSNVIFMPNVAEMLMAHYPNMGSAASTRLSGYLDYDKAIGVIFFAAAEQVAKAGELINLSK